jgi:type III pantothenate kinase
MSLLMDGGNTRLKLAHVNPDSVVPREITAIAYADLDFEPRLTHYLTNFEGSRHCFFASVAANVCTEKILQCLSAARFKITIVQSKKHALGVQIAYQQPSRLGVDRFLSMIAAHHDYKKNLLIASVGTAMTLDLLDHLGEHRGGVIAASESFVHQAMGERFAVFKDLDGQPGGFSNATDNALATGLRWMQLGAIDKALQEAKTIGMNDVSLLLCGGGAEVMLNEFPEQPLFRPHLVLEGLALWAQAHV